MQEKLKIFSAEGEVLLEFDLSSSEKPLMILAGEKPRLVETVPQGAEVLGALVRDEDGWTLASAKSDSPVSSGPKVGADFHLTAGVSCSLGSWVFRIEREGSDTGTVLLWRVGSSAIVADPLIQGRNMVTSTKNGSYAVNPAILGIELCSIVPTSSGVDVMPVGESMHRLSVPYATLFAVGQFQAMALPAADAAAAIKSGSPFGWSARKTRAGLLAALIVVALVCLAALAVVKMRSKVDSEIAVKQGAVQIERPLTENSFRISNEDILVYKFSFYRSLPLIIRAERSPIAHDLISRGEQLLGDMKGGPEEKDKTGIGRIVKFLKDVDTIQKTVNQGDWQGLKATVSGCDTEMFTHCDADVFRKDAIQIAAFVTEELPRFMSAVAKLRSEESIKDISASVSADFARLKDNMFMSGEIVSRERAVYQERRQVLASYMKARSRFLSTGVPDADIASAWADMLDVFDPEDTAFAEMLKRERNLLSDTILKRAEKAPPAALIRLCSFGETVGVDPDKLAEWAARAAAARKEIYKKYREMYSDYRMRAAVAPDNPETLAVLDAMMALGVEDNHFHQWALREKERLSSKKAEKAHGDGKENGVQSGGKEENSK